jgi:hypothetical protein
MFANYGDEIVESRTWSSGVEIVAHLNWSHVARVRRALGLAVEAPLSRNFVRSAQPKPEAYRTPRGWSRAAIRAA